MVLTAPRSEALPLSPPSCLGSGLHVPVSPRRGRAQPLWALPILQTSRASSRTRRPRPLGGSGQLRPTPHGPPSSPPGGEWGSGWQTIPAGLGVLVSGTVQARRGWRGGDGAPWSGGRFEEDLALTSLQARERRDSGRASGCLGPLELFMAETGRGLRGPSLSPRSRWCRRREWFPWAPVTARAGAGVRLRQGGRSRVIK